MGSRITGWAKTRKGGAAILLAIIGLVSSVGDGWLSPLAAPAAFLVYLAVCAGVIFVFAGMWEAKTFPATPRFARESAPSASRQLREDANVRVWSDHGGFLFERRCFFVGTGCPPIRLRDSVGQLAAAQGHAPVTIAQTSARRYWWYQNRFSWENQGLAPRDVQALLHDRERKRQRDLQHAHTMLAVEQG